MLTGHRMLHPHFSVKRLYTSRKCEGYAGLFQCQRPPQPGGVQSQGLYPNGDETHTIAGGFHREVVAVDGNFTPLSMANENWRQLKVMSADDRGPVCRSKELHRRFYKAFGARCR
jgi:hypothetical protein